MTEEFEDIENEDIGKTLFRFDLLQPQDDPVSIVANRPINKAHASQYATPKYVIVNFRSNEFPTGVTSFGTTFPARQLLSGVTATNLTTHSSWNNQYFDDIDFTTSRNTANKFFLLSYPFTLSSRSITNGAYASAGGFVKVNLGSVDTFAVGTSLTNAQDSRHLMMTSNLNQVIIIGYSESDALLPETQTIIELGSFVTGRGVFLRKTGQWV
jgi:hypothetical protein